MEGSSRQDRAKAPAGLRIRKRFRCLTCTRLRLATGFLGSGTNDFSSRFDSRIPTQTGLHALLFCSRCRGSEANMIVNGAWPKGR
jgi:hypothetical protein